MDKPVDNFEFDEIHEGEAWLAGVATPAPSARAITSTKAAMRAELVRLGRRSGGVARWHAWHGALAAAACISLCVTVGWRQYGQPGPSKSSEFAKQDVILPEEVLNQSLAFNEMDEQLSSIEEAVRGESDETADGALLYEVLSNAVSGSESSNPAGSSMRTPASGSNQSEDTI